MIANRNIVFSLIGFLIVFISGCESEYDQEVELGDSDVKPMKLGSTDRIHNVSSSDIWVGSQPSVDDFALANKKGLKTVINLRKPDETPDMNEAKIVQDLGMTYHNPSFYYRDELTEEKIDRIRHLLSESERPILLHCTVSDRTSAVWLPYRVLDEGISLEQAVKEARVMGLRTEWMKQKAIQYIRRHQEKPNER